MGEMCRALAAVLALAATGWGQVITASITGVLQDATGAVLPSQEVRATSAQGIVRTTRTTRSGLFSFAGLAPSTYTVTIAVPGFLTYHQEGIALTRGGRRSLGVIRLQVGLHTEAVTVSAETSLLITNSGERAEEFTGEEVQSYALRGRDFLDAVSLLTGVVDTADTRDGAGHDGLVGLHILGARSNSKNMTVDGVTNVSSAANRSAHFTPTMGAVGEVKVLMSNYAAEYGRNAGGTILVMTRGGGRQFQGSAGWYWRHERFFANDFFANRNGQLRPANRSHTVDYNVGGPVYIPGRWNQKRTKMFFFWSQEFQRQLVNWNTRQVLVPTLAERDGDFSDTRDVNGRLISVLDPNNSRRAFPGNVVPASRFSQAGQNILKIFPLPNFVDPDISRRYQWNYVASISSPFPRHTEMGRVDYSPRKNVTWNFRGSYNVGTQSSPWGYWSNGSINYPLTPAIYRRPTASVAVRNTLVLAPTLFNEITVGAARNKNFYDLENPSAFTRAGTGIDIPEQWNPGLNPRGLLPNMSFSGVANYARPSVANVLPYKDSEVLFTMADNISKVYKKHTVKAGVYAERSRRDQNASVSIHGTLSFDRDGNNPLDTNYPYASALLGVYQSYSEPTACPRGKFRFTNLEAYVQDVWRARRNLMLDFGLRLYHDMPQVDQRGNLSTFLPERYDISQAPVLLRPGYDQSKQRAAVDPLTGATYSKALIGTFVPGVGDRTVGMSKGGVNGVPAGLYSLPPLKVAPRLGFAWDPVGRGRTVIRGGGGVYYDRISFTPVMDTYANPPNLSIPMVYYGTLQNLRETAGQAILAPSNVRGFVGRGNMPTTYNFSLGVQRQLKRTMFLDVSYVGSITRHLLWLRNYNAVPAYASLLTLHPENMDPTTRAAYSPNFLRPYQGYGDILLYEFASTSNYNSLQASFNRRLSRGVSGGAGYTFSKALGSADYDSSQVSPFFSPRSRNYARLSYDRTHVMTVRVNWQLPRLPGKRGPRPLRAAIARWELAAIGRFMSGSPFTPGYSLQSWYDPNGTISESARMDVKDPGAPVESRFGPPARNSFGNMGRNVLCGPGMNNWDMSLFRTLRIAERRTMQVRVDTYNTFNHTQFQSLNTTATFNAAGRQVDPLFLQPSLARTARRMQVGMRLNW